MNRRALLAALGASTLPLAGCLGDGPEETASNGEPDGDDQDGTAETEDDDELDVEEYEECTAPYVNYEDLPEEIAAEVDVAFEDGVYETDDELLYDRAISDRVPLWKNDTPYRSAIETDGDTRRLSFEEKTDGRTRELFLRNSGSKAVTVTATVTDDDGSTVLDEQHDVDPDEESSLSVTEEFGEYEVEVDVDDGPRETYRWTIEAHRIETEEGLYVVLEEDGVSFQPLILSVDYLPCTEQWKGR